MYEGENLFSSDSLIINNLVGSLPAVVEAGITFGFSSPFGASGDVSPFERW